MNSKLIALILVISEAATAEKDNPSHRFTPGLNEKEITGPWRDEDYHSKLRILSHPAGHERARNVPFEVKVFSPFVFFIGLMGSAIYVNVRLKRISKTKSSLEKETLRRELPRDLVQTALIVFGLIYLADCVYGWVQDAAFDTWTFSDRFSLQLGPVNERVNFDVVFSMKWRNLPATQRGPQGGNFATYLSSLLEDLDSKMNNQEAKNTSSYNELDVYLATVRLWSISPPSEGGGDPEVRSKWVNFLNEMATFLEKRNSTFAAAATP